MADPPSGSPSDRRVHFAWALLAALYVCAFLFNHVEHYAALLLVLAVPAALVSGISARAGVILVAGTPALDSFAIIATEPQVVTVFQVVLVAALAGAVWRFARKPRARAIRITTWDLGILLFLLATVISLPFSHAFAVSAVGVVETAVLVGMYLFLSVMASERASWEDLTLAVILTSGFSAIVAIGQAVVPRFPVPLLESHATGNAAIGSRVSGFFANPNSLALMLVLATVLAVEAAIRSASAARRISYGLVSVICAVGLAVTYSREAFVGLAVAVVALVLFASRTARARLAAFLVLVVVAGALLALPGVRDRARSILGFASDPSAMDRVYLSEVSLKMFADHPLTGIGMSAFMASYPSYKDARVTISPVPNGHQLPFDIPAQTGVVGLLAELLMVGALVLVISKAPGLARERMPVAGIAAALAFFVMSFVNQFYFAESFWITLALVGAIFRGVPIPPVLFARATPTGTSGRDPFVSILTPSFNQAPWLADNLHSVACQTYPNIEHIVMDGGSADGSVGILRAAGESVRWRSERDHGQSHAVNKAFAESLGEIIGWINSDDAYFDCRVVEDVVAFFTSHPDVDVVYGHCLQTTADGHAIQVLWAPRFDPELLLVVDPQMQPATFVRRSALAAPMLDESFDFAMDYELWLRLASRGHKFARLDRIVAIDRHQSERKSSTIKDIHTDDLGRLNAMYGLRASREWDRRRTAFYVRQRVMGALLIPRIRPAATAFDSPPDMKSGLLRRQVMTRRSDWPDEYR